MAAFAILLSSSTSKERLSAAWEPKQVSYVGSHWSYLSHDLTVFFKLIVRLKSSQAAEKGSSGL